MSIDGGRVGRAAQLGVDQCAPLVTIRMMRALKTAKRVSWNGTTAPAAKGSRCGQWGSAQIDGGLVAHHRAGGRDEGVVSSSCRSLRDQLPAEAALGLVDEQVVHHQLDPVAAEPDLAAGVGQVAPGRVAE